MSSAKNSKRTADAALDLRALTAEQLAIWEQKTAAVQALERGI
jgi:hypothetical protein